MKNHDLISHKELLDKIGFYVGRWEKAREVRPQYHVEQGFCEYAQLEEQYHCAMEIRKLEELLHSRK